MDNFEINAEELYLKAEAVRANAYAPYSNFRVGAALAVARKGSLKIYKGVNVENATFGATVCAERSAVSAAVSDGAADQGRFLAIAISAGDRQAMPCGICRQVLAEFQGDDPIKVITKCDGVIIINCLDELLPSVFAL